MRHHYTVECSLRPRKGGLATQSRTGSMERQLGVAFTRKKRFLGTPGQLLYRSYKKETHSSADYCFPGFCCFPLKKLSSWTLSSRKMQIATEYVIEKTWHKFKNSGPLSKRHCKASQTLSFRGCSSLIPHSCVSCAASTQPSQNLWGWKGHLEI